MLEFILGVAVGSFAYSLWNSYAHPPTFKLESKVEELDGRVKSLESDVGILISTPKD
jgi:hypothetical protein